MNKKSTWQEQVNEIAKFHEDKIKKNSSHPIVLTAKMLGRSFGSIAEALMIVDWVRSHPRIAEFKYKQQAIDFIRDKKKEMRLR
jgi:hypothetical protein